MQGTTHLTKQASELIVKATAATASVNGIPALKTTPPVTSNTLGQAVVDCRSRATAIVTLGGKADGGTINYRAVGWQHAIRDQKNYYRPTRIAYGVGTVGTFADASLGDSVLACDTLTETDLLLNSAIAKVISPTSNYVAQLILDVTAFDFLEIDIDLGTATEASVAIALLEP